MTPRFIIYGLIDPRDGLVHYIGKSCSGLARARRHGKTTVAKALPCGAWLRDLRDAGLAHEVIRLDVVEEKAALGKLEVWWIAFARSTGWPLTNVWDGGHGAPYGATNPSKLPHVREAKKAWAKAYANSPEALKRMREHNPLFDPKTKALHQERLIEAMSDPVKRAKISAYASNRPPADEASRVAGIRASWQDHVKRARRIATLVARNKSPENRARVSQANRRRWAARRQRSS